MPEWFGGAAYNRPEMDHPRPRLTAVAGLILAAGALAACRHSAAVRLPAVATPAAALAGAFELAPNLGFPALRGARFGGVDFLK